MGGGSDQPSSSSSCTENTIPINALHYAFIFDNYLDGFDENNHVRLNVTDRLFSLPQSLYKLCTESDKNSILHLAARVGQLDFIDVLSLPRLSEVRNSKGELPLHVAARSCQLEAVKRLLADPTTSESSILLKSTDNENNTALHIALENHQKEMAKFLFDSCKQTFYYLNLQGFSPLYLAIKAEFWDLVNLMLSVKTGDRTGEAMTNLRDAKKSVVHAVILAKRLDVLRKIIIGEQNRYSELVHGAKDEFGRSPLSYAAYIGFHEGVECIITTKYFENEAYKGDENGYFPIHWACKGGNVEVVKEFFSHYPVYSRWLLSNKERNILHIAAEFGKVGVVNFILQQQGLETMINMKDEDGNTPFHLGAKGKHARVVYLFTWDKRVNLRAQNKEQNTALDIAEIFGDVPTFEERLTWLSLIYAGVPRASPLAPKVNEGGIEDGQNNPRKPERNNTNSASQTQTPSIAIDQQGMKQKRPKYKERINTLLVVSTLVATVAFTAGFTVPGGYKNENPHEGMATLAKKCAFQVFVIANTVALYSSMLAAVTLIWAQLDDLRLILVSLNFALPLLGISLFMVTVAFTAGLYVVLQDVISWLTMVILVMGGVFLGALFLFFLPLYSPYTPINNRFLRYFFNVPFTLMLLACEKGKTEPYY